MQNKNNFFLNFRYLKDAKLCHLYIFLFIIIYTNMIFYFVETWPNANIKIFKCIFERRFCYFLSSLNNKKTSFSNTRKRPLV